VAKLGISSGLPYFLEALLYRVLTRASRPQSIVLDLSEYQFTTNYQHDSTSDFWQISDPIDPGYMIQALRLDSNRWRLARGWLLPVFANYPIIAQGVHCGLQQLQGKAVCRAAQLPEDNVMTSADRDYILNIYRDELRNYSYSNQQATYVREAVSLVRARGVAVKFVILPVLGIDAIDATAYELFRKQTANLAGTLGVPLLDLHRSLVDDTELWGDPSHLNRAGAARLSMELSSWMSQESPIHGG